MKVYGKNPVIERLKADPKSIQKLYVENGHPDAGYIYSKAKKWGIPVHAMTAGKMDKISRNLNAQGVMAEIGDYLYIDFSELVDRALLKKMSLVFLDGITDPQNLGGILRSLACLGGFGAVLPSHDSVSVTEAVLRVACGGDNFVPVAKVSNLGKAIKEAKDAGFFVAGTTVKDGVDLRSAVFQFPLGLVIGSEQKGIRPVIEKYIDMKITLPMAQPRLSLNAAHATAIFCYEISKQRMSSGIKN
jgi:23S rRNA (guanosine2251-2'-O)-methyltransferase